MLNKENLRDDINKRDRMVLFLLLFLPCLLIKRVLDNDTWFLLNSGRYVVNYGIPYIEPFSIHANMKFIMQQWLTNVVFWITYNNFGENGLFLIVVICYTIITFLFFKLNMKISSGNFFVSFAVTLFASILIRTYMVTRPTIFTLIIVMIELNALESFVMSKENKHLIILPILSLLMINLHAALWPILFILIVPYIIDSLNFKIGFIENEGFEAKYLFLIIVAMILIAFINPYNIGSMTYLIKTFGNPDMKNIMEIKPPYVNHVLGASIYMYIITIAFIYIFYRKGNTKVRYFLLTIGTIYMVLTSVRNITYFAVCSLFPLSYYLKDFRIEYKNPLSRNNKMLRIILLTLIIIIVVTFVYIDGISVNTKTIYLNLNNTIDYILDNEDTSNIIIYTGFGDGSLVEFRGLPSYIDPRAEVYFKKLNKKDDIFNEYFDLQKGNVYYKEILEKYKFSHLIVSKEDILNTYLPKDDDYEIIYSNESYSLYKKIN